MSGSGVCSQPVRCGAAGWGGLSAVSKITGFARSTLARGLKELEQDDPQDNRQRRPGAGRLKHTDTGPTLLEDLKRIIAPWELGDPERTPTDVGFKKPSETGLSS